MANRIKGITIEIDGNTTPLTKALKSVNSTISKTQSELRDVNKLLKLDPSNTQLLQQKQGLLQTAIVETNKKLEEEKKALEQLRQSGNTEETQAQQRALEREIIATEQSLDKLASESIKTKNALDGVGDEAEETGKKAEKGSKGWSVLKGAMANLASDAASAAIRGLKTLGKESVEAVKESAKAGDEIDKMSQKLGLSRKGYQEWDYVLTQAGVDINSLQTGMKTMTNKIDAAKKGTDTAVTAFDKLGISVKDLDKMSREDAFNAIVTSFQGMEDTTERAALANQLFGKSGQNLIPLFNESAEATKNLKNEANELGAVMGDDAVNAAVDFQDRLAGLTATFTAVKNGIMSTLLPSVTEAMAGVQELLAGNEDGAEKLQKGIEETIKGIEPIIAKLSTLLQPILTAVIAMLPSLLTTATQAVISLLPPLLTSIFEAIPPLLSGIIGLLPQLVSMVGTLIGQLLPQLGAMLPQIVTEIIKIVPLIVNALIGAMPQLLSGAFQFLSAIVDALPQLISLLTTELPTIINTIVGFITNPKTITLLVVGAVKLLEGIVTAIPLIITSIVKAMPTIITAIGNGLTAGKDALRMAAGKLLNVIKEKITEIKEKALTWGRDLLANFIQGIKDKIENLKSTVTNVAKAIKDLIGFSEPKKGPLSNFHTYAPDMVELFTEGIYKSLPSLQKAMGAMAGTVGNSVTNNRNVTVNQYNSYSAPHSQYELWKSEQALTRTINNTVRGAI